MENRFWFCDPSRKRRRGDDDVQYACESYARPSGDVSHGFLREVERRRREHVFYSVIPAVILRTWDEGLQAYPEELRNRPLHAPPSMKSRLLPMAASARCPSANLEVPFASHCDTRTIRVLGELAITLPVKDRNDLPEGFVDSG